MGNLHGTLFAYIQNSLYTNGGEILLKRGDAIITESLRSQRCILRICAHLKPTPSILVEKNVPTAAVFPKPCACLTNRDRAIAVKTKRGVSSFCFNRYSQRKVQPSADAKEDEVDVHGGSNDSMIKC